MNPTGPGYVVSISPAVRERLRQLSGLAAADGRIEQFLTALRTVLQRLQDAPTEFGEELYDLHAMRLTVRVGVVLPIAVEFSIHPTHRVVFATSFQYVVPG